MCLNLFNFFKMFIDLYVFFIIIKYDFALPYTCILCLRFCNNLHSGGNSQTSLIQTQEVVPLRESANKFLTDNNILYICLCTWPVVQEPQVGGMRS